MELEHNKSGWIENPVDSILASHSIGLLPSKKTAKNLGAQTPQLRRRMWLKYLSSWILQRRITSDTEPTWSSNTN
jgi:hypothetical protein